MDSIAMIAARFCGRSLLDNPETPTPLSESAQRPPWRRAPRTKTALAGRALAIEAAVHVLEDANIPYTHLLFGKLIVDPRSGQGPKRRGRIVTYWPARERLRIGRRPTQTRKDLCAFQQALADQGHRIPGYLSRAKPKPPPRVSKAERLRAHREANLADMEEAHAQLMASLRQMVEDLEAGRRISRRDPRSARARRLFQRAWARPA